MKTSVITQTAEPLPRVAVETEFPRISGLLFACGAMTVHYAEISERHDFESGAIGVTNVEVALNSHVDDDVFGYPEGTRPPYISGNLIFVPAHALMQTHLEIARKAGLHSPGSASELELSKILNAHPVHAVAWGGLVRYWDQRLTSARTTIRGSVLVPFDASAE